MMVPPEPEADFRDSYSGKGSENSARLRREKERPSFGLRVLKTVQDKERRNARKLLVVKAIQLFPRKYMTRRILKALTGHDLRGITTRRIQVSQLNELLSNDKEVI